MVSMLGGLRPGGSSTTAAWNMHMVARTGAPPLRFSGRLVHSEGVVRGGSEIFVKLWEKKRDGFVMAYSLPTTRPAGSAATSLQSLEDAITTLANVCADLRSDAATDDAQDQTEFETTLVALFDEQKRKDQVQDFLNLSGLSLAKWDAWSGADAPKASG